MNNEGIYENALRRIEKDKQCKPRCMSGPTGPTGPAGPQGETPTISIGTVSTGLPGTDAEATITGTAPDFVLNLTIPAGPTGPAGSTT